MSDNTIAFSNPVTLSEGLVKQALEDLDWASLKAQLEETIFDEPTILFLLGHLRRTSSLIMKYPNKGREKRRKRLFDELTKYCGLKGDPNLSALVSQEIQLILQIEVGYRNILDVLATCAISRLPPDVRTSAYISRAGEQYLVFGKQVREMMKSKKEITLSAGPLLMEGEAHPISPDAIIATIVESLTITLVMEAYKNNWFDAAGCVTLPQLLDVGEGERFKAGSSELLAICWGRWKDTEERRRFLGGSFKADVAPSLPKWAPHNAAQVIFYYPDANEGFDFVANERLADRLIQTYMEMKLETNIEAKATGLQTKVPLLPKAYVTAWEAHAAVSLSEILSYDIVTDIDCPGGLRFVEWVRGYAVLTCLAERHAKSGRNIGDLIFTVPSEELMTHLTQCGLTAKAATAFVDAASLKASSRDMFDCPLVRISDGSVLVFGPGLLSTNSTRIILSNIARLEDPLSRKGKAFERDIVSFLKKQHLTAQSFEVKRAGQTYEYDAVLCWGDYVFVFECKNHSLSNHHPIQAYYFDLETRSNAKQVKRLAAGLSLHPDIIEERFGIDVTTKTIIPCVLNSLPFSRPGRHDGVYFSDASALKRFFQERYFHVNTPYRIDENIQILHRSAVHSLWESEQPTPEDLLRQLEDPFQFNLMLAHTELRSRPFAVGTTVVVPLTFARKEMTLESYSELAGVSPGGIRKEKDQISGFARKLSARSKRKARIKRKRR